MKRLITFTASMVWEADDEWNNEEDFATFEDIEKGDYDNVGRPLYHLEDLGWKIEKKSAERIEETKQE